MAWGLDFGTTNTRLSRWDPAAGAAQVLRLPRAARGEDSTDPLRAPTAVPTVVHLRADLGFWGRLGATPALRGRVSWGRWADIGREAEAHGKDRAAVARGLKPWLSRAPLQTLATVDGRPVSAREAARAFLRELFLEARELTGTRIDPLTLTTPVDAYETYRAELGKLVGELGVKRARFVDEPVAAAIGYGLGLGHTRRVMVVDFGGGTLDLALVELDAAGTAQGTCRVLGKSGRTLGGDDVDLWLLDELFERAGVPLSTGQAGEPGFWRRALLSEARALKESLYFTDHGVFLAPGAGPGMKQDIAYTRDDLAGLLERQGLTAALRATTDEALQAAGGLEPEDILMVGGSTLLPGVFAHFQQRFGRDRVRAWQPFEAVSLGAAALAAEAWAPADYIVHDYAIRVHGDDGKPAHEVVVPRGTRFPTADDFWRRRIVPACALGEPERVFKLVICELGPTPGQAQLGFDAEGRARLAGAQRMVVPLNERDPTMGTLNPPHPPGEVGARLDLALGVNADRWLCATVRDLKTEKVLLKGEPVVRLM